MEHQLQYLLDVHAIRDISVLYNRYADAADGDAFASLWVEDGEFDIAGDKIYKGREEIATACRAAEEVIHIATDSQITIEKDSASQISKLILFHLSKDKKSQEFAATTTVTDSFIKREGRWYFKSRRSLLDIDFSIAMSRLALIR